MRHKTPEAIATATGEIPILTSAKRPALSGIATPTSAQGEFPGAGFQRRAPAISRIG